MEVWGEHYGGLAITSDPAVTVPFVLRKETVEVSSDGKVLRVLQGAIERVQPACVHFGKCGGCQYQMIEARQQVDVKRRILWKELTDAGVRFPVEIPGYDAEGYGYRNRIRLRAGTIGGVLRLGYNVRSTAEFLTVTMCPIAAPVLWSTVEALLKAASIDDDVAFWMNAASEVEFFCNDDVSRVQVTLLCAPRTKAKQGSLARCLAAVQREASVVVGLGAIASDARTGPTGRTIDAVGAPGLNYRVGDETYWVSRGGFFQVNRFLLETLVGLVCDGRSGGVAWDLFAGVGLFSRVLARSYDRVVAVEANAVATGDNRAALKRIGAAHEAVESTTLEFLAKAAVHRERPELIVLDPPRAGAGVESCELLLQLAAGEMVYVSCDPTTLARDLAVLQRGYSIAALHVVDLFPQTFHLETVVVLRRKA